MTVLEALKLELEDWENRRNEDWLKFMKMAEKDIPYQEAVAWYERQPSYQKCIDLSKEIRRLEDEVEWSPFEEWDDDIYTLKQFVGMCKEGGFIDYDGFGVYADKNKKMKTNIEVYPSDITSGKYRKDFPHVVWYNK